jgi:hypothetical protein
MVAKLDESSAYEYTIVDGYNRHIAVLQLLQEKKLPANFLVPYAIISMTQIVDAKAYSFNINCKRRNLTNYQEANWFLKVYPNETDVHIAKELGLTTQELSKVKSINKVVQGQVCEEMANLAEELQIGEIAINEAMKQITNAEKLDAAIADIEDDSIREELEAKHVNDKLTTSAKTLADEVKELQYKAHPELKVAAEQAAVSYAAELQPIVKDLYKLYSHYEDNVVLYPIDELPKLQKAIDYLKKLQETGKDPITNEETMQPTELVVLYKIPKEMLRFNK